MSRKRTYDREGHAHFVTFSCYRRRRLVDHDRARQIVLGVLNSQLAMQGGQCIGFVVMPDHVHAIVLFAIPDQLSHFMKHGKQRSSVRIKRICRASLRSYAAKFPLSDAVWQPRYDDFDLYSRQKIEEKLNYMHMNPVRSGLVSRPSDWPWSSARYYETGRTVGVPVGWPL